MSDCWIWPKAKNRDGYGTVKRKGASSRLAHRVIYEELVGPIPEGLTLDHLCRNRGCVNPAHLEPVTRRENVLRGSQPNVLLHRAGRCKQGHQVKGDNVSRRGDGRARCRECINSAARRRRANAAIARNQA